MNGKNPLFTLDPFGFASSYPINALNMKASNTTTATNALSMARLATLDTARDAYFDLEPASMTSNEAYLRAAFLGTSFVPSGPKADTLIHAYWVPYRSHGQQGHGIGNVPYVDLPTNAPLYNIMFTGAMNGCSLVVTDPGTPNTIRVWHDSMHEANTFNGLNVVARLDFDNASFNSPHFYGDATNPASFNFLYFNNNHWYVVSQPHTVVSWAASLRTSKPPFQFQVS